MLSYASGLRLRCARKMVRGLREAMTEDERYAVADHVVTQPQEVREPMEAARRGATERRTDHRAARGVPTAKNKLVMVCNFDQFRPLPDH